MTSNVRPAKQCVTWRVPARPGCKVPGSPKTYLQELYPETYLVPSTKHTYPCKTPNQEIDRMPEP